MKSKLFEVGWIITSINAMMQYVCPSYVEFGLGEDMRPLFYEFFCTGKLVGSQISRKTVD